MTKPLPTAVLKSSSRNEAAAIAKTEGINLGDNIIWNPCTLPNGSMIIVGASGSGKTQTLKAIAYELPRLIPTIKLIIIDFHGDQSLPGEVHYPLNMESKFGVNPLTLDLDTKGGGPSLQAIAVAAILRKALTMGVNQEGLIIDILTTCYKMRGINQEYPNTWISECPTFKDVREEIDSRIESGCKESVKLSLKLAAMFEYGIFTRPQPSLNLPLIRFDLSALGKVPGLGAIAAEAIIKQIMDSHRLQGEILDKIPRSYIIVDEAKEIKYSQSTKVVVGDGRKYGLCAILASQRDAEISAEAIANSSTKIVLAVDQTEVSRVAKRFRFADKLVSELKPLEALIRMGTEGSKCKIKPYYERV